MSENFRFYNTLNQQIYTLEGLKGAGAIRTTDWSIEDLKKRNYLLIEDNKPTYDPIFYHLIAQELVVDLPHKKVTQPYLAEQNEIDEIKTNLREAITSLRWEVETGGTAIAGIEVLTGIADQNRIASICLAAVSAKVNGTEFAPIRFKTASGEWVEIDAETLIMIGNTVTAHVEACFKRESELHAEVEAAQTFEELQAIDYKSGWNTQPNSEAESEESAE